MPHVTEAQLSQIIDALTCYTETCGMESDEYTEIIDARDLLDRLICRQDPIEALWRKVAFRDPLIGAGASATPERCRSGSFMFHMPAATPRSPHKGTVFFTPEKRLNGEWQILAEYEDPEGNRNEGSEIPFRIPTDVAREPFARCVDDYMMLLKGYIAGVGVK